jgi:phospholipase C
MKLAARTLCLGMLCALSAGAAHSQITNFQHIIVIFQENRTPDNLFQGLCVPPFGRSNSCSTTPTGKQYNIQSKDWRDRYALNGVTQPTPIPLMNDYDLKHDHPAFVAQCNKDASGKCRMDGAGDVICVPHSICQDTPQPQFRYVDYTEDGILNPYLQLATQYGWANYMFQTNQGGSYPAHQYIFGATSAPSAEDDRAGTFAAENTAGVGKGAGCVADPGVTVQLIDAYGVEDPGNIMYPCFEHDTMADLLSPLGISWKYYAPGPNGIWVGPNSIGHICQASGRDCLGFDFTNNVDPLSADVLTDIANCELRQVSWVIPIGDNSDHARDNTGGGPAWVASIVNAVGNSWTNNHRCDYWGNNTHDSTAIFITWDDWGGWYDHEPPAILAFPQGGYQYGFRVPLIVVSAYTPVRFVSNARHDFGSIIRFIEHNFGIEEGALTFADARAASNLTGFFKFGHAPRAFKTIDAPQGAEYFLTHATTTSNPDDD